jgi:hypothetical protein
MSTSWLLAALFVQGIALFCAATVGYHAGENAAAAEIARAKNANEAEQAAIAKLQASLSQCEGGRLVDAAAQARALNQRAAQEAQAQADYEQAQMQLKLRLRADCRDWAQAPACGSVP